MVILDEVLHHVGVAFGEDGSELSLRLVLHQHPGDEEVVKVTPGLLPQGGVMATDVRQERVLRIVLQHEKGEHGTEAHAVGENVLEPLEQPHGKVLVGHDVTVHDHDTERSAAATTRDSLRDAFHFGAYLQRKSVDSETIQWQHLIRFLTRLKMKAVLRSMAKERAVFEFESNFVDKLCNSHSIHNIPETLST